MTNMEEIFRTLFGKQKELGVEKDPNSPINPLGNWIAQNPGWADRTARRPAAPGGPPVAGLGIRG
jgi:hypothetical protein